MYYVLKNRTYWIWKDASYCVEMVLTVSRRPRPLPPPPTHYILEAVGVVRPPSRLQCARLLGVFARAHVLMSESLFSIYKKRKKKKNNTKWVCVCVCVCVWESCMPLFCTGVPKKTYAARSPILKKTRLIQRDCPTYVKRTSEEWPLTCGGGTWH